MTLDQELAVDFRGALQIDVKGLRGKLCVEDGLSNAVLGGLPLVSGHPGEEPLAGEVSGQPDARGNDDLALRPVAAKPFSGVCG